MASSYAPSSIDLSRLLAPDAIETLDFEALLAARMADFKLRASARGFEYDVGDLETDPIKIDQEAHAYRELLMRARVNDGIRSVLPAYARKGDLDHIVARANISRILVSPGNPDASPPTEPVYESDAALLQRYLVSFAEPACGSEDGYISRVLRAWPAAHDVMVANGGAGKVLVYVLAAGGAAVPMETIFAIAKALEAKDARPLTDDVSVQAATIVPYSFTATVRVPRGPDPALVRLAAENAVWRIGAERYRIGEEVFVNALESAAYVPNVRRVTPAPGLVDIPSRRGIAPLLTSVTLTHEVEG